jgi:hypothetical protein
VVVEPMAHLMEDGEHTAGEVAEIEPESDAAVAGAKAGAAGMKAEIDPATAEIEAHRTGDLLPESSLALEGDRAPEHRDSRPGTRAGDPRRERDQVAAQRTPPRPA